MKGRPPKPAAVKLLKGTWRKDRHGDPGKVVAAAGEPVMPISLIGEAKALWEAVVPGLVSAGIARACDATELASMCEWYGRYRRFTKQLDDPKAVIDERTYVGMAVKCWACFDKVAARFGLTPSDRARIQSDGPAKKNVITRQRA